MIEARKVEQLSLVSLYTGAGSDDVGLDAQRAIPVQMIAAAISVRNPGHYHSG